MLSTFSFILGYFLCPKCNVHGDWNIMERLLKKAKLESSLKEFIESCQSKYDLFQKDWLSVLSSTQSMSALSETEVLDLFRLFEFPVSISHDMNENS